MNSPTERPPVAISTLGTPSSQWASAHVHLRPWPGSPPWRPRLCGLRQTSSRNGPRWLHPRVHLRKGQVPPFVSGHGQIFHTGDLSPMVYGKLAHRMALNGHILQGNHEFARINGPMPATNFNLCQALHPRSQGLVTTLRHEQRFSRQQNVTVQGVRGRRNQPPPRGAVVTSDRTAIRHLTPRGQARSQVRT
jgi:hypothetical protein